MTLSAGSRWVRVDCHLHTVHSGDAVTTIDQLRRRIAATGLNVVCITDHHTLRGAHAALEASVGARIIVGEEIRTSAGEIIGLFLHDRVPYVLPLDEAVARVRTQHGLVYAPHPCDPNRAALGKDQLTRLAQCNNLDVIETFNAKVEDDKCNRDAVQTAWRLNIPAAAGSDAHDPEGIGAVYIEMPDFDGPSDFKAKLPAARIVGELRPHTPRFRHSLSPPLPTAHQTEQHVAPSAALAARTHGDWCPLGESVLLGDAGQCAGMLAAGATWLIDLRAEAVPPAHPVPVEHFPIEDLTDGQGAMIVQAATRVHALVHTGQRVGIYCQSGRSRTAAVAIAYLVIEGYTLNDALMQVRQARPQAMPAIELWHAVKKFEHYRWTQKLKLHQVLEASSTSAFDQNHTDRVGPAMEGSESFRHRADLHDTD